MFFLVGIIFAERAGSTRVFRGGWPLRLPLKRPLQREGATSILMCLHLKWGVHRVGLNSGVTLACDEKEQVCL